MIVTLEPIDGKCIKDMWHGRCLNRPIPGSQFCGIHDPDRKKARAAKRGPSKWERDMADQKELHRKAAAYDKLLQLLSTLCNCASTRRWISARSQTHEMPQLAVSLDRQPRQDSVLGAVALAGVALVPRDG